jgi:hypothetical protein
LEEETVETISATGIVLLSLSIIPVKLDNVPTHLTLKKKTFFSRLVVL